jgi:hypothetical protein
MRTALSVLAFGALLFASPATASDQRLALQVSPIVAIAPANVTVRATIDADVDNRLLEIVVESSDYRRSSEIQLDGKNAPRLNVFELRDIPTGVYEVRARLVGAQGPRASSMKLVKIEPAGGR